MTLHVAPRPCESCPYRRDVPSGVWAAEEYEKLIGYDEDVQSEFSTFHCHQENATGIDTVCRGWLTVARESVGARLAVLDGRVTDEQRYAEPLVPLWPTGRAAAEHGLDEIKRPSERALAMMAKLTRRGAAQR